MYRFHFCMASINSMPIIKNSKHRSNSDERVLNWKINIYYLSLIIISKNDIKMSKKKKYFFLQIISLGKYQNGWNYIYQRHVYYMNIYDVSMFSSYLDTNYMMENIFIVNKCQLTGKMELVVRYVNCCKHKRCR